MGVFIVGAASERIFFSFEDIETSSIDVLVLFIVAMFLVFTAFLRACFDLVECRLGVDDTS